MQDTPDLQIIAKERFFGTDLGEGPHPNDPVRLEHVDQIAQVLVADGIEFDDFSNWELIRRAVFPALFHKDQRAIVRGKMIRKEIDSEWVSLSEEAPEAATTDFAALAGKALDRTLWVHIIGTED